LCLAGESTWASDLNDKVHRGYNTDTAKVGEGAAEFGEYAGIC
jgi:hypothetical protein